MPGQFKVTPWKTQSELLQVRREIYQLGEFAAPVDNRRHAVDWIGAWKMRGSLPHAVESTAHLVDAVLHHDALKNSTFSIRATYSAAFCRFVTGFCDMEQNKIIKRNMYEVAREIDMPASFVELRHEATHQELPSLQRLARNSKIALDWLWQHYWARLDEEVLKHGAQKITDEPTVTALVASADIREILSSFMNKRRKEIKTSSKDMSTESASGVACLELVKLCKGLKGNLVNLAKVLLEVRMLIPAGRSLGDSMEGAYAIWGNLLRRLAVHQQRFLKVLLEVMMSTITQQSHLDVHLDAFREAAQLWVHYIYTSKPWMSHRLLNQKEELRSLIVNECIMTPSYWSMKVAKTLIKGADEEFRVRWEPMVDVAEQAFGKG